MLKAADNALFALSAALKARAACIGELTARLWSMGMSVSISSVEAKQSLAAVAGDYANWKGVAEATCPAWQPGGLCPISVLHRSRQTQLQTSTMLMPVRRTV